MVKNRKDNKRLASQSGSALLISLFIKHKKDKE
jgi:hypothetical protein